MKIHKEMLERWRKYSVLFLAERGLTVDNVHTGADAWEIAHKLGIPREAYHVDASINDDHIETALRRIFPYAVFVNTRRKDD